jgi:hypothetical protein
MTATTTPRPPDLAAPASARSRGRAWGYHQYLGLLAVIVIVYQTIGWASWWGDTPVSVTQFRDRTDESWWLARVYESLAILTLLVIATYVVRKVRRERRWGIEAQFCLAGLLTYWQDPFSNAIQPLFWYSSNWVNLNEWTGNLPFVRNPDAGRMPEPILFGLPLYISGFLAFAKIMDWVLTRLRARFQGLSTAKVFLCAMAAGLAVDVALELPMYLSGLWAFPGTPDIGLLASDGRKFPVVEMLAGAAFFGTLAAMIHFKDDRGRTPMERGLEHLSPQKRTFTSQLALIGVFNGIYLLCNLWWWGFGMFSGPVKPMERHTVNALCDAPGWSDTRYGKCMGDPGYSIPLPGSLPGSSPSGDGAAINGPNPCAGCPPVVAPETKDAPHDDEETTDGS